MEPSAGGIVAFLVALLASVLLFAGFAIALFRGTRNERRLGHD